MPNPDADEFSSGDEPRNYGGKQPDPAVVAAIAMLFRALSELPRCPIGPGAPSAVSVVRTPTAEWLSPVREAWRDAVQDGLHYADGSARHFRDETWYAFVGEDRKRLSLDDPEAVSKAIWRGKALVGFAADPEAELPFDLIRAADHRVLLSSPTPADVADVARTLGRGVPTTAFCEPDAADLTPRLFRLASRRGQSADEYVSRLAALLALDRAAVAAERAEAAKPPAEAPRDTPTLSRLHGMDEAVAWGEALARDLAAYGAGRIGWGEVDRGCLLSGPPGCGKTLFARALAATCGVPLVSGSYGQWLGTGSAHQGDLLKAMSKSFAEARKAAPSVLFIDEVDSFPDRAAITHHYADWEIQVVNALLAEIDGVEGRPGVVLLGACNHPEKLDAALVRSGRLDRHIRIGLPDRSALARILREQLGADLDGADLGRAVLAASGSSGADCERMVRGARRRARAAGRGMAIDDLIAEIGGDGMLSPAEARIAAVHEAGHAVAACLLLPGSLDTVSLRGSGDRAGYTVLGTTSAFVAAEDMHYRLVVLLSGRAAEEAVLGGPSSGAGGGPGSDLALATRLASIAAAALGFDTASGLAWQGLPSVREVPGMMARNGGLRAAVSRALAEAYSGALELVTVNRTVIEEVAGLLADETVLEGATVHSILQRHL